MLIVLATIVGLAASPPVAAAGPDTRWTLTPKAEAWELRWRGTRQLPVGGERLTVRQKDRVLGYAREDGSDAVLRLSAPPASLDALELWRGGRRMDLAGEARLRRSYRLQVAPTPANPWSGQLDPGLPGPYRTQRFTYQLAPLVFADYQVPIEVLGEVTVGLGAPKGAPLVLILHGRHVTCYQGGPTGLALLEWPCPPGWQPIRSYAGYHAIADLLASQGNVVVSISANSINSQDGSGTDDAGAGARSALIRHHLRLWADWSRRGGDPRGGRLRNAVDMRRVILVGHSRGGEGVARAAIDSRAADPWRIIGLVPIGPTAFGAQVPVDTPSLVILPYCDGDVSDLQGQIYVDGGRDLLSNDRALRSALLVRGANHNFFNAEWTPGLTQAPAQDDWDFTSSGDSDLACGSLGPNRLAPRAQQRVGATYTAALVRFALANQNPGPIGLSFGALMRQYLEGDVGAPPSADRALVQASALGADRRLLYRPRKQDVPATTGGLSAAWCAGAGLSDARRPTCWQTAVQAFGGTPHWIAANALDALQLRWTVSGSVRLDLAAPANLRSASRLDMRIALGGETPDIAARFQLIDADGRVETLRNALRPAFPQAGDPYFSKVLARTVSGDLDQITRVDLSRIVAIRLLVNGRGAGAEAFVLDLAARGRSLPAFEPRFVPVAHVGTVTVNEGAPGLKFATVPIRIDQPIRQPVSYWLQTPVPNDFAGKFSTVTFRPGGPTRLNVTVPYQSDDLPYGDRLEPLRLYAKRGGLVGNYQGGALIREDDQGPLRLSQTTLSGTEGTSLMVSVSVAQPMSVDYTAQLTFGASAGPLAALDSDDVTPEFFVRWAQYDPPPLPLALSAAGLYFRLQIPAGATTGTVEIPLKADGVSEGTEAFSLKVYDYGNLAGIIDGTVTD